MNETLIVILIGAAVSAASTTIFLFCMSPFLMGPRAPALAQRLIGARFSRARIMILVPVHYRLMTASAVLVAGTIVMSHTNDALTLSSSDKAGGTMAGSEGAVL